MKIYFYSYRNKSDTEKALYRLLTIGLIDDYRVDFHASTYTISGKKKTDDEYLKIIFSYIRKYYSERKTRQLIDSIQDRKGKNIIYKILNFLIEFVYKEIGAKRKQSIDTIRDTCIYGYEKEILKLKISYIFILILNMQKMNILFMCLKKVKK